MVTINISLPEKLKEEADDRIARGHYASFSDLVRTALRDKFTSGDTYDRMAKQAMDDYRKGKATALRTDADIKKYIQSAIKQTQMKT